MRFGIMEMQLDALVPPGLPAEQIMLSIMSFDHSRLVQGLAQHGFNPIELGGDLGMFLPNVFSPESITKLAALKEGNAIENLLGPLGRPTHIEKLGTVSSLLIVPGPSATLIVALVALLR